MVCFVVKGYLYESTIWIYVFNEPTEYLHNPWFLLLFDEVHDSISEIDFFSTLYGVACII